MDTPEQLASLEGQQFLVLRPTTAVADVFRSEQAAALGRADVPHPRSGYVTLRGFAEPARRELLSAMLHEWAAGQRPVDVVAEAVDAFPAPLQIVMVRLTRTASLTSTYSSLSAALATTDFQRPDERPVEASTFHLPLIHAKDLAPAVWTELAHKSRRSLGSRPSERISQAEFVWYEGGTEHAEVIHFGGR